MPSRAYTSFLRGDEAYCRLLNSPGVNALSGLYIISTFKPPNPNGVNIDIGVNALSSLYIISTEETKMSKEAKNSVSMPSQAYTSFLPIPRSRHYRDRGCVNALSGLYIISTVPLQKPRFYAVSRACFCRYLSEYSDNSRFSCMLTFWTYLMRCTYP